MSLEASTAPAPRGRRAAFLPLSLLFSLLALILVFWGLLQLDLPLTRFMRSVHLSWLEQTGDWLARLGSGAVLTGISLSMLAWGRVRAESRIFRAGLDGLIAHGAAALLTQILKHTIGRPRPRMTHGGGFEFGPSFDSGLDSFPSGHSSASFAVATVLARHFPSLRWVVFPLAALIAASRIWRGSHFPTDVMTGVLIGVSVGLLAAYPAAQWRQGFGQALPRLAIGLVAAFALLWTTLGTNAGQTVTRVLLGGGTLALLVGLGARWRTVLVRRPALRLPWPTALLGLGLAFLTGAWQVAAPAAAAALAWCLAPSSDDHDSGLQLSGQPARHPPPLWMEAILTAAVLLAALVLRSLQGVVPLLA